MRRGAAVAASVAETVRVEAVDHAGSNGSRANEAGILEHAQVLGDRGLRERQSREDVGAAALGLSGQIGR